MWWPQDVLIRKRIALWNIQPEWHSQSNIYYGSCRLGSNLSDARLESNHTAVLMKEHFNHGLLCDQPQLMWFTAWSQKGTHHTWVGTAMLCCSIVLWDQRSDVWRGRRKVWHMLWSKYGFASVMETAFCNLRTANDRTTLALRKSWMAGESEYSMAVCTSNNTRT